MPLRPYQFSLRDALAMLGVASFCCLALSTLLTDPALFFLVAALLVATVVGAYLAVMFLGIFAAFVLRTLARLLVAVRPLVRALVVWRKRQEARRS